MKTIDLYRSTVQQLRAASDEAEAEAREIMAHVYGVSWGRLSMRLFDVAEEKEKERVRCTVQERLTGRPLAYVLGSRGFYGADFEVDERVLIPRQDTESVVEKAVSEGPFQKAADVCCGSGCIGITLLREGAARSVLFTDVEEGALEIAKRNRNRLCPQAPASFRQGDLLEPLQGERFDLLIANPPYISEDEYVLLDPQVRAYEPRRALVADAGGLGFYKRLVRGAGPLLTENGMLLVEIGCGQSGPVEDLFREAGFRDVQTGNDLAGRPRYVGGRPG